MISDELMLSQVINLVFSRPLSTLCLFPLLSWQSDWLRVERGQIWAPATKSASFAPQPLARSHVIIDSTSFHCSHGYQFRKADR